MANLLSGWDKIRRWLDNEPDDEFVENVKAAHDQKSESELFLLRLLNEVETVLKDEIVRIPNTNKAYAPDKFVVRLSGEADKNLRKDKREFFEQNLSVLIYERAREMAGQLQLTAKKMSVEIQVDPTLEDEIEVRAVSKNELATVKTDAAAAEVDASEFAAAPENPLATFKEESAPPAVNNGETIDDFATVRDIYAGLDVLYTVEIFQGKNRLGEYPIIKRINTVGRGGETGEKAVNLRLPGENLKISRTHAEIELDDNGEIWVTALHKNPTIVSGQVIRNGERAKLGADGEIMIYDFTLKIKW